ncbi:DUF4440 domain-containing protein [Caenorhabditis elegans]|uniref:DUF4440 domain-containing protein n=1 Tax=Caenorhabditis elegans TaxID=6239 RepID=H2KYM0_CAEEL|nr:DUF4440 domain-containing protein [Caenorhabditis elegans]CCD63858.1 DUF4440 domain-containing protein [Caenorhabditis elegans]|eukprot:NP_741850.1 Uncharacterized protein CELE_C39D10.8 [Caenorhabditis elegans]
MEVRTQNCNVDDYAAKLFKVYSDTVFADDYEGLLKFYDDSAVLIERGKGSFYGVDSIIGAIKAYHAGLGPGTTKNSEFKVEHTDNVITIRCKYRVQSVLAHETWEGEYIQYWRSEIGQMPKIIRDEFSIDKKY